MLQSTRQHPQGGAREALSNSFWFLFIINVQYEYNWIRLHQLTYPSEIPKWTKIGTPLPGYLVLKGRDRMTHDKKFFFEKKNFLSLKDYNFFSFWS